MSGDDHFIRPDNDLPKPMKQLLDFDDPGASDDEPVKGVTVGDIRAWYDQYDQLRASWIECRELLFHYRSKEVRAIPPPTKMTF